MTAKPKVPSSYRVSLTRLASNNANLRTPNIEGVTAALPKVGQGFRLVGESLTKGASFRLITTSKVTDVEVINPSEIKFFTENSSYNLAILPDEEEE